MLYYEGVPVNLTPAQFRVLAAVEELGPHVSIASLAEHFGGHPNAARRHLTLLQKTGLLTANTVNSHTSGRPAKLYTITDNGRKVHASHRTEQARLDALCRLAGHIADGKDAAAVSYDIGKNWGLSEQAEFEDNPMKTLTRQGFAPAPTPTEGEFDLLACPLLAAARQNPDVICSMHRGFLDGALVTTRAHLTPFATPRGCRVAFTRRSGPDSARQRKS